MASLSFRNIKVPSSGRMSASELRAAIQGESGAKQRSGKFNNRIIKTDEGVFDSATEYNRYLSLKLLERAGEISNLARQVRYKLDAGGIHISTYVADFVYNLKDGSLVVEDSKGFKTREYLQKRRLMKEILGIDILETGPSVPSKSPRKDKMKNG